MQVLFWDCYIYQDLRLYLDEPYDEVVRETQAEELQCRIQALAMQRTPTNGEPDKLRRLKAQLLRAGKDIAIPIQNHHF